MTMNSTVAPRQPFTTLMVRQIPRKCTAWDIVNEFERFVARVHFDFVYVPWISATTHNMGYAFVNFLDENVARAVLLVMKEQAWSCSPTHRLIKVEPAHTQGFAANLSRFQQSVAYSTGGCLDHAPLLFHRGVRVPLSSVALTDSKVPETHVPVSAAAPKFQAEVLTGVDFFDNVYEEDFAPFISSHRLSAKSGLCLSTESMDSISTTSTMTPPSSRTLARFVAHSAAPHAAGAVGASGFWRCQPARMV